MNMFFRGLEVFNNLFKKEKKMPKRKYKKLPKKSGKGKSYTYKKTKFKIIPSNK
jgi:hypothetical protein